MSKFSRILVPFVMFFVPVALHGQEPVTWKVASEFEIKTVGGGLAWDGESLWVSTQSRFPDELLRYSRNGQLERVIRTPFQGNFGGGLTFFNGSLFVLDYTNQIRTKDGESFTGSGAIYVLAPDETLNQAIKLPADQFNTFGLAHTKKGLIYGHSPTVAERATIYVTDMRGKVKSKTEVEFYISGMTHDGKNLWVSSTKKVLRLNDKWEVTATFIPPEQLGDLTWDGKNIWGVVQNTNRVQQFRIAAEK